MYAKALTLAVLLTSVAASDFFRPHHYDFGAMLKRGNVIAKRQGYYPTTEPCGSGDTCEEACGAGQVQCPSTSGMYCYDPTLGHCCPDGSGYSCDNGYFCTTDGAENTYCCPEGMELGACAAAYSLTVSLIRETGTPSAYIPSATETPSVPAYTTSSLIHITATPYPTAPSPSASVVVPPGNVTYTTNSPPQFTGAAAKVAGAGMAVLAGAAGIAGLL